MMSEGIWCFATPTFESAMQHPTNHYEWMIQGGSLLRTLNPSHPLADEFPMTPGKQRCFETFPHAITCALIGAPVLARNKRLVAHLVANGAPHKCYGNRGTGLIVLPSVH